MTEHGRAVKTLLYRVERDPFTREELYSDVFALAHRRLRDLESLPSPAIRSWLLRTARYLSANSSRRSGTRRRVLERLEREPVWHAYSAEHEAIEHAPSSTEHIRTTLDGLRPEHREILMLQALGQPGPKLAKQLGISHQAARARLSRARRAFLDAYLELEADRGERAMTREQDILTQLERWFLDHPETWADGEDLDAPLDEVEVARDLARILHTSEAASDRRRRRRRAIGGTALVIGLGAGSAGVAALYNSGRSEDPTAGAACRADLRLDGDAAYIPPEDDPIAACRALWESGVFAEQDLVDESAVPSWPIVVTSEPPPAPPWCAIAAMNTDEQHIFILYVARSTP